MGDKILAEGKTINAQEAWEMTRRSSRKNVVDVWIKKIHCYIEKAAGKGHVSLPNPFRGFWMTQPTNEEARGIANYFECLDFTITHYPYPDGGFGISWGDRSESE